MRNILLNISYDGTDFCGWQRQDAHCASVRTVQSALETALEKIHRQKITLYGSGRTDSGVHALAQAANFFSPFDSIPVEKYPLIINNMLPPDIRVMSASVQANDFNARKNATSRVYRYFIVAGGIASATVARYTWQIERTPDIKKLNGYLKHFRGERDCASFAQSGDASLSTKRYIERAAFFEAATLPSDLNGVAQISSGANNAGIFSPFLHGGKLLVFEIEANAFLWKMVRTLCGTLLALEKVGADEDALMRILDAKDRRKAGVTAPPQGLFLWRVNFDGKRRHV